MKGTGPDRDRSQRTPGPWEAVQDVFDKSWRILHRHRSDNSTIVALVADEGDAKLICDAINLRAAVAEAQSPRSDELQYARDIVAAYDAHEGPYTIKCGTVAHALLRCYGPYDAGSDMNNSPSNKEEL